MRPSRAPRFYAERIRTKLKKPEVFEKLEHRHLQLLNEAKGWNTGRDFHACYNPFFSIGLRKIGLGKNLIDILSRIPRQKKQPLKILEDGPGEGIFLTELKEQLGIKGIISQTTALAMHHMIELQQLKILGELDKIIKKSTEEFIPEEQYHAIFSVYGGISYTLQELRKDIILKFAHSLVKGGVLMIGFDFYTSGGTNAGISRGLSENPQLRRARSKKEREIYEKDKGIFAPLIFQENLLTIEKEMEGIEKAFAKQGFKAKFVPLSDENQEHLSSMPNYMLIIQRIR
ncbi:MAG: class I SAM-dependent methyltransferase [Candidatus Diapherotrites archaeon]|nr:class I SAM-dependent methyltransferase [Candidatus Diapherotrites archaeon]